MRPLRALALAAPLFAAAAATHAGEPVSPDAAPPRADGDGGADAATDAAPDAGAPLPVVDTDPFPEKRSERPKEAEWVSAPEVTIHRWGKNLFAAREGERSACQARRLREWVRVECDMTTGGVLLLGGNTDGLFLTDRSATLPVRRGDRREIEFLREETSFTGYHGMEEHHRSTFDFTLSEQWAPGDERPWLVAN